MKKKIALLFALIASLPLHLWAQSKGFVPLEHQPGQVIAGVKAGDDIVLIRTDENGNLLVGDAVGPLINGNVIIPNAGLADRTQLPDNEVHSCLLQAKLINVGPVYVGGKDVTNATGINEGILLHQSSSVAMSVTNTNQIYVATDNAGDAVKFLCN